MYEPLTGQCKVDRFCFANSSSYMQNKRPATQKSIQKWKNDKASFEQVINDNLSLLHWSDKNRSGLYLCPQMGRKKFHHETSLSFCNLCKMTYWIAFVKFMWFVINMLLKVSASSRLKLRVLKASAQKNKTIWHWISSETENII